MYDNIQNIRKLYNIIYPVCYLLRHTIKIILLNSERKLLDYD